MHGEGMGVAVGWRVEGVSGVGVGVGVSVGAGACAGADAFLVLKTYRFTTRRPILPTKFDDHSP